MKLLLATLLCLLTFTSAHAQGTWPRNSKTGKVELRGSLPWPASAKTEAQRRALVRRWYLAKLTDSTPAEVKAQAATDKTNGLLTYAGLPKAVVLRQGEGDDGYLLGYFVQLIPAANTLNYTLTRFDIERAGDVEGFEDVPPLDQLLPKATTNEKAALTALRKRLAVALAGW